jgi:RNA-directed DNA polymerase
MAKTYKNLFPRIISFEALYNAWRTARKGRRYKPEVLSFGYRLEENLLRLQDELRAKTYQTGQYKTFYVYEPKQRFIVALPFRDRIVHHAVVSAIGPIWEKRFIKDSYACRVGKGTHAAVDRAEYALRVAKRNWEHTYCLKADIAKYYHSINHDILKRLIRRYVACEDTLWLVDEIIDSARDLGGPEIGRGVCGGIGIPIGNLTSQLFANIYLHELDIYVKQTLCEPFYVRYMDDFVIFADDKEHLQKLRKKITNYVEKNLQVTLNGKTQVIKINSSGLTFLGYRLWPTHRLISNSTKRRIYKKIARFVKICESHKKISCESIASSLESYLAHLKHCNSFQLRKKILNAVVNSRIITRNHEKKMPKITRK